MSEILNHRSGDYERDLGLFCSPDPKEASDAFERLWKSTYAPLERFVRRMVGSQERAEDVCLATANRAWGAREGFEVRGAGGWWKFLTTIARNIVINDSRKKAPSESGSDFDFWEIPDRDLPLLDILVIASEERERLYELADSLWLGVVPDSPGSDDRLLATQLFFVNDWTPADIVRTLNLSGREELDKILEDAANIRQVMFRELYWSNVDLAGYLLRKEKPYREAELEALVREAMRGEFPSPEGWTWEEILIVCWWVYNGLKAQQILHFERCGKSPEDLEEFLKALTEKYPFGPIARKLKRKLTVAGIPPRNLGESDIWKRLVFQYHCSDKLPQRQIQERTAPAADVFGGKVDKDKISNWLSLGRLFSQICAFAVKEGVCN